jgi:transcriptional regulator with XRE-family HTH domain
MLGWSAQELAERTGMVRNTILRLERFSDVPPSRTQSLLELKRVFEQAGIIFVYADDQHGPGVRLANP